MSEKFTYIDFLMYVIPGSFLAAVLLFSICLLVPQALPYIRLDFFSGIIFLVFSFILGNFLQVYSHKGPENRLKKEYWKGLYPSQIMFFPENPVINEHGRDDLLRACVRTELLSENDIPLFSSKEEYDKTAINKAQNVFNYMQVYLVDKGKGERIRGAEGFFLFFRGIFVTSFWAGMAFLFVVVCYLARLKWLALNGLFGEPPPPLAGFVLPLVGTSICLWFWRTFRYRCRGAAQGFAREVYRAFCAHVFIENGQQSEK